MKTAWEEKIRNYAEANAGEAQRLLKELAVIPAPSGKEKRRADYCRKWLEAHGAEGVYEDSAGNVIYPWQIRHRSRISVYMAHMDVVFPDEDRLVVRQKDNLLIGPGVGDDTANLVNLLMAAAFFAKEKPPLQTGILFVADTGEEGLGNLKGCRQLMEDYGKRILRVVSLDLYMGQCFTQCVGSLRYEITVRTEGGHSFSDFGNASAVHEISRIVCALYEKKVPDRAQTTYNVGVIQGGTSVNTIAQEAKILYEIRSVDAGCMEEMHRYFMEVIRSFSSEGMNLEVKQVGERPCAGRMDEKALAEQEKLIQTAADLILSVTGEEASQQAASTDANIPLSLGIPAITLGTVAGGKAHTRQEWVDLDSQRTGMKLILRLIFALQETDPVHYENDLAVRGDTLLEVLDKKCSALQIPMYIHRIADDAFNGIFNITVNALECSRLESLKPLLRARRAVLQIWSPDEEKRIRLPLSHTGGFDASFLSMGSEAAIDEAIGFGIDFEAYDSRFPGIQDKELKLDMAVSRLLYPVRLSQQARSRYEQHLKNRFRPAMLLLAGGVWNPYGRMPGTVSELLNLKKTDPFLKKELLQKAVSCRQTEFIQLLTEMTAETAAEAMEEAMAETEEKKMQEKQISPDSPFFLEMSGQELWQQAAGELYHRRPSMEAFCGILSLKELPEKGEELKAGTDGNYIYYTRQNLKKLAAGGRESLARFYTHMLVHCIYLHPFSNQAGNGDYELACDVASEYAADQIFGPDGKWMKERQMVYDCLHREDPVLTADRIYKKIVLADEETRRHLSRWFIRDCHDFWPGSRDSEKNTWKSGSFGWLSSKTVEKWSASFNKWSLAGEGFLQAGEKKAGKRSPGAGYQEEEAQLEKRQGHDYRDFLRQFMVLKEDRILDLDSYDPVYYTYGLNTYGSIPLVEPLETKEVMRLEELVIVIDTSGSCSGRLVRFFLEETWSVFGQSENFFNQFHVRILQCDAAVQEDVRLTSLQEAEHYMKNLVIKGGGGTDFREAFSYIRQLQKKGELRHLKGILYFTDGFGTFPTQAPGCRTAFIFLKSRFGQVEVPYWADKLLLELPEGADWEPEYTGGFQSSIIR